MSSQKPRLRTPAAMRLTDRDKQIMVLIFLLGGMISLKQIDRRFFSGMGRSQPRQRMRVLFANGYVQMPSRKNAHRIPQGETIYWLDDRGAEVVAAEFGVSVSDLKWRRKPRFAWLEHDIAVNDLYLQVVEACAASEQLEVARWIPETEFLIEPDTVHFVDRLGKAVERQVRPDGFLLITRRGDGQSKPEGFAFLLEIDMATHSNPRFEREKVRAGIAYLGSDTYRERFGLQFGRWLVITTGEQRLRNLRNLAERAGGARLFYFTTFEALNTASAISPIAILTEPFWEVAGSWELTSLIPNGKVS